MNEKVQWVQWIQLFVDSGLLLVIGSALIMFGRVLQRQDDQGTQIKDQGRRLESVEKLLMGAHR